MRRNEVATCFWGRDINLSKENKRFERDLNPMSRQDN